MNQSGDYVPHIPLSTFEVAVPEDAEADAKARARVEDIFRELEREMAEEKARAVEAEQKALESLDRVNVDQVSAQEIEEVLASPVSKISEMVPELGLDDDPDEAPQEDVDDTNQVVVHRADVALEQKEEIASEETASIEEELIEPVEVIEPIETAEVAETIEVVETVAEVEPVEDAVLSMDRQERVEADDGNTSTAIALVSPVQDEPKGFFASIGSFFARLFRVDS